jgi:imidazolonepropionase
VRGRGHLIIGNIGTLYTVGGHAPLSGSALRALQPVQDALIVIEDGFVLYAGARTGCPLSWVADIWESVGFDKLGLLPDDPYSPYPPEPQIAHPNSGLILVDAAGALATPGLVDPHTHVIYGGSRENELVKRLAGVPYLQILAEGGGILSSVRATTQASDETLYQTAAHRLRTMLQMGTTTVEVKSGYGLTTEQELRLLRIIDELARTLPISIVPTFLGAHAIPESFSNKPDAYVDIVVDDMIPAVARQGLARFCDVFCEKGIFTVQQSKRILMAAKAHGLALKLHADEIEPTGGAELAAEIGAISADHLIAASDEGLRAMAEAGVVAVLLPATSFNLGTHRFARARAMIDDFNLPVALATDANPGSSPTESAQLVMTLAAGELKMTPEEILVALTLNAAHAIGESDRCGSLEPGKVGDVVLWRAKTLAFLAYHFGVNHAQLVVKGGQVLSQLR